MNFTEEEIKKYLAMANAIRFLSADAVEYIKRKLNRKKVSDLNLSRRELQTLKEVFDL